MLWPNCLVAVCLLLARPGPAATSDPLLLEYSDYYYDLYYGDYDNYEEEPGGPRRLRYAIGFYLHVKISITN